MQLLNYWFSMAHLQIEYLTVGEQCTWIILWMRASCLFPQVFLIVISSINAIWSLYSNHRHCHQSGLSGGSAQFQIDCHIVFFKSDQTMRTIVDNEFRKCRSVAKISKQLNSTLSFSGFISDSWAPSQWFTYSYDDANKDLNSINLRL